MFNQHLEAMSICAYVRCLWMFSFVQVIVISGQLNQKQLELFSPVAFDSVAQEFYICISVSGAHLMCVSVQLYEHSLWSCVKLCLSFCEFFKFQLLSSSLPCVRFPCPRSIPAENTLLWSSAWNPTPVMIIIQVRPQVRDFTLEAALVYLFLSAAPSPPFLTFSHTYVHYSVIMLCTVNTDCFYCWMQNTARTHTLTFGNQ